MQIDLANTLSTRPILIFLPFTACEAHLLPLYSFTLYCPQTRNSPPLEGLGEAFGRGFRGGYLKRGGHTDKQVNHKMDFDFEFD